MIQLGISLERTQRFEVHCHPDDEAQIRKAWEGNHATIIATPKCKRGEWYTRIVEDDQP